MDILTNGRDFLHGARIERTDPAITARPEDRLETLAYGPVEDTVSPRTATAWWGGFQGGETLRVEVCHDGSHGLLAEILDEDFRLLARHRCRAGVNRVEVILARAGVHHVRLRHDGDEATRVSLRILVERAAGIRPEPRGSRLGRWGLPAWLLGSRSAGEPA